MIKVSSMIVRKRKRIMLVLFFYLIFFGGVIGAGRAEIQAAEYNVDSGDGVRIVIEAERLDDSELQHLKYQEGRYYILFFEDKDEAHLCYEKYQRRKQAKVEYIEKAHVSASGMNDYQYLSWGAEKMHCNNLATSLMQKYEKLENLPEITVGIIDSGIDYDHPVFADRIVTAKYDYVDKDNDAMDNLGHGTHVAGIIVDSTLSNVRINAYRVADERGEAYIDDIVLGIQQAIDDQVDVINMSLGAELPKGGIEEDLLREVLNKAIKQDVVIVTAAGNGDDNAGGVDASEDANVWPASYLPAITVSAVDEDDKLAKFSNYGSVVDLCAPGVDINSAYPRNRYKNMSGTSMACPLVTGAAALLLTDDPVMSYQQVTEGLESITVDLGEEGVDNFFGYGLVDLGKWQVRESTVHRKEEEQSSVKLNKVTVTSVRNEKSGIHIQWKKSANAQGYYIYRKDPNSSYKRIKSIASVDEVLYTDKDVINGKIYQYKIVPYLEKELGECKKAVRIARLSSVSCSVTKGTSFGSVKVSVGSNKKATRYQIQYSCNKSFSDKMIKTFSSKEKKISKKLEKLKKGKRYFIRVRCLYKKGKFESYSAWSAVKSITIKDKGK